MQKKLRTIRVIHPEYGSYTAAGVKDRMEAVIQAAKHWGVQWSQVAKVAMYQEIAMGPPESRGAAFWGEEEPGVNEPCPKGEAKDAKGATTR